MLTAIMYFLTTLSTLKNETLLYYDIAEGIAILVSIQYINKMVV